MSSQYDKVAQLIEAFSQHKLVPPNPNVPAELQSQGPTTVSDFSRLLAEQTPGVGDAMLAEEALEGDRFAQVLAGLGVVPFLGGALRGMKRLPKFYHGTRSAYNVQEILDEGFARGKSAELNIPGTSVSRDPTVSLNMFADGEPRAVLIAEPLPDVTPADVANLKPSAYLLGQVPEAKLYNKPNLFFNEAETFFPRRLPKSQRELKEKLDKMLLEKRKDAGKIDPERFKRLYKTIEKFIDKELEVRPAVRGRQMTEAETKRVTDVDDAQFRFDRQLRSYSGRSVDPTRHASLKYDAPRNVHKTVQYFKALKGNRSAYNNATQDLMREMLSTGKGQTGLQSQLVAWGRMSPARIKHLNNLWNAAQEYSFNKRLLQRHQRNLRAGDDALADELDLVYRDTIKSREKFRELFEQIPSINK